MYNCQDKLTVKQIWQKVFFLIKATYYNFYELVHLNSSKSAARFYIDPPGDSAVFTVDLSLMFFGLLSVQTKIDHSQAAIRVEMIVILKAFMAILRLVEACKQE